MSHVGRLDENRQPQLGGECAGRSRRDLVGTQRGIPRLRNAVDRGDLLGHRLVHRDRGTQHASADIGKVRQLQHALHGSVFAERAMQQRHDDGRSRDLCVLAGDVRERQRGLDCLAAGLQPTGQRVGTLGKRQRKPNHGSR